ncbi:MAG: protein-disulfide reductase DsbD domain-containing protein [Pseudomonadota bacterium]
MPDQVAQLELMEGWRRADGTHVAALRITLAPGWKTYWRSPGDGGLPLRLSFDGGQGFDSARIAWPVPKVFYQNGLRSIGYEDEVILPLALSGVARDADISVSGEIDFGVCEEICVPMQLPLEGTLSAKNTTPVADIVAALADRPMSATEAGVGSVACSIEPISDGLAVSAQIEMVPFARKEALVMELPDRSIWISEPDMERQGDRIIAISEMVPPDGQPFLLDRSSVRITIIGEGQAVEILGCE